MSERDNDDQERAPLPRSKTTEVQLPRGAIPAENRRSKKVILASAVGTALIGAVASYFVVSAGNATKDVIGNLGPPVEVSSRIATEHDSHVFANDLILTKDELAKLNKLDQRSPAYAEWFSSRGGAVASPLVVSVELIGNRKSGVRVIDAGPKATCGPPYEGAIFESPSAGVDGSLTLQYNLDHPSQKVSYSFINEASESVEGRDFFGDRSVHLEPGESQVINFEFSTQSSHCDLVIELRVLDEGSEKLVQIDDSGNPFSVSADLTDNEEYPPDFSAYATAYIGGVLTTDYPVNGFSQPPWVQAENS